MRPARHKNVAGDREASLQYMYLGYVRTYSKTLIVNCKHKST